MTFDLSVFAPVTPLEWGFMIALSFFFSLGIISSLILRRKWRSIYKSGDSNNVFSWDGKSIEAKDVETSESLLRLFSGLGERWVSIIPGMLLVIGILGTFIGLMFALGELGVDLGNTSERQKVIESIGTQFKTSIWGIAFNLLFLVTSNVVINFKKFQSKAFYLANTAARNARKNRYKRGEDFLQNILSQLISQNEIIIPRELTFLNQSIQKGNHLNEETNQLLQQSIAKSEVLIEVNREMAANMLKVEMAVEDFKASSKTLLNGLKESTESFVKTAEEFTAAVKNFDDNTQSVLALIKEVIQELEKIIAEFSTETRQIFNDPEHGLKARLENMQKDLTRVLTELKDALTGEIKSMNKNIDEMVELNDKLTIVQTSTLARAEQQDQHNEKLSYNAREALALLDKFNDEIMGQEGRLYQSIDRAIQKIYDPAEATNGHILQGIAADIGSVKSQLNAGQHLADIKQTLESVRAELKTLLTAIPQKEAPQDSSPPPQLPPPAEKKPPEPKIGFRKPKKKPRGRK